MTQRHPSLHVEMFITVKSFLQAVREDSLSGDCGKGGQQWSEWTWRD